MTGKRLLALAFASATLAACSSTDSSLRPRDAGAGGGSGMGGMIGGNGGSQGTGFSGTGGGGAVAAGAGGNGTVALGTGGVGTGGGAGMIGTGGTSLGRTGGSGGNAGDAGHADAAKDAPVSTDGGGAADVRTECGPGYPIGSVRTMSDGCNTCACMTGGVWMCSTHVCPPDAAAVDGGRCPQGTQLCSGCTPGSAGCYTVCPPLVCPADGGTANDGNTAVCSALTTQADCEARNDCHAVFVDPGTCGCAGAGCCARFSLCADGGKADCTEPTAFSCTIPTPFCELPYVLAYEGGCYEGCVLETECGL